MTKGTIRWFNPMIGAGFIRTDAGENVLFLKSAVRESDPFMIREGARVDVETLESPDGFTAISVKADGMAG